MSATSRPFKPLLAFTCGDPAGLGPETALAASRAARKVCRALLIGEASIWRRAGWKSNDAVILDTGLGFQPPKYGKISREAGRASFAALKLGFKLASRRLVDGLITAPISKKAWDLAGIPFRDHTEFFKTETGASNVQMILGVPRQKLWCVLATRHVPLAEVGRKLTVAGVLDAARALEGALKQLGLRKPRLGLCGFNPHAGEDGLLGREEKNILIPAVAAARRRGLNLCGPIPADTAWRLHGEGRYDGLVALYHDQALIPLKMAAGLGVVNWTVGLSFIRTSPGHGTGFDVAGRGVADCGATVAAAELAAGLWKLSFQ